MDIKHYDIIIVGDGIVGLTAALWAASICKGRVCLVSNKNLQININLDREIVRILNSDFAANCYSLNRVSVTLLQSLGVWELVARMRFSKYNNMQVWEQFGPSMSFTGSEVGQDCLGYIVEQRVLFIALCQCLSQCSNLVVIQQETEAISHIESAIILHCSKNSGVTKLSSQLLIGADGANSWIRNNSNIISKGWSYQQYATVATLRCELSHESTAWQCFTKNGPLAILPLADPYYCSLVWSNDNLEYQRLSQLDDQNFAIAISEVLEYRFGKIVVVGARKSFPLKMQLSSSFIEKRIALVGEAAHVFHPLAGLGLNCGLEDVADLMFIVQDAYSKKIDIGQHLILRRYERARKPRIFAIVGMMEVCKQLFATNNELAKLSRRLLMRATQRIFVLKRFWIQQAGGVNIKCKNFQMN